MKKPLLITLTILLFTLNVSGGVYAYTLLARDKLTFDETLFVKEQDTYAFPEKILVTRVRGVPSYLADDTDSWVRLLYYYFVTRLQFADIPFNYLVSRDGTVIQGRSGWEGVIPELQTPEGAVMIAYLSNGSDLTLPANNTFGELIADISYKFGIERDNIEVIDITIAEKEEGALSKLQYNLSDSVFATEFKKAADGYRYTSNSHISVKMDVGEVSAPAEVPLGEKFEVSVPVTNSGQTPWFTFNDFIYVVTVDEKESKFAVNEEWDSFETPTHIEGETIFPHDEHEIKFPMKAPLIPGDYTQRFSLKRLEGGIIDNSTFTVSFKVTPGDLDLVKISETETGNLNVRSAPSTNSEVVGQVDVGDTLIMLQKQGEWYKIRWNGEEEGWVFGRYVEEL